jgi:large subunit ribosomal protein L35
VPAAELRTGPLPGTLFSCIGPALRIDRLIRAAVAIPKAQSRAFRGTPLLHKRGSGRLATNEESQMPKMKTKSGAKKRFKITATGKVMYAQSGKRHGMIKRSNKQIREHRGTTAMFETDAYNVKRYFLPNG